MQHFFATIALILFAHTNATGATAPSDSRQRPARFSKDGDSVELQYLRYIPQAYDAKTKRKWPLILFLHGAGERGDDLDRVAIHGPPQLVSENSPVPKNESPEAKKRRIGSMQFLRQNFVVISPQCPADEIWNPHHLSALLDDVVDQLRIDKKRIYLTGLSMGGYGTWDLGLRQPGRFAAIAPICGGANTITPLLNRWNAKRKEQQKHFPIWVFHGAKDTVVPMEESDRIVKLLTGYGNKNIKLTIYPEAGHNVWTETYANPDLYRWLLSKSLP
ncbi:MAG: phospholipase [Verrucomicrobiales bacterium]|nr:phospholipase [Verrucomicrobiales bacterium]